MGKMMAKFGGGKGMKMMGGIGLGAGDFYSIDIDNVGNLFFEASEDGQILNFIYYT